MNPYLLATLVALPTLAIMACTTVVTPTKNPSLSIRSLQPDAQVVTVKVGYPWYIPRFAIVDAFRKAIPEYQAAPGLEIKSFSFSSDGRLGGVYLWKDKNAVQTWFNRAWVEKAKARFGYDPDVRFIDVNRILDAPLSPIEEGPFVIAITAGLLEKYQSVAGLRYAIEGSGLVISSWVSREAANAFFGATDSVEWFETPVVIANK